MKGQQSIKMYHTVRQVKQHVNGSGRLVEHTALMWSTAVFLSWIPELTVSISDALLLMGEPEAGGKAGDREPAEGRYLYWLAGEKKDLHSSPLPVQTYGVIRTTLPHCCSSHLPTPPSREPFNQPPGEYMDMIWERKKEEKETGWEESISEADTIAAETNLTHGRLLHAHKIWGTWVTSTNIFNMLTCFDLE